MHCSKPDFPSSLLFLYIKDKYFSEEVRYIFSESQIVASLKSQLYFVINFVFNLTYKLTYKKTVLGPGDEVQW